MHGLPTAAPAEAGLCPDRTQRIVQALQRDVDRGRLPGASVLIARRGRVVLDAAVGRLDPARETPMGTDAIFRIYSMTKPIVSVAAMVLVEQGRLLLSDAVGQYVPGFLRQQVAVPGPHGVALVPATRPSTVQDLLRHTAGLTYEFTGNGHVNALYSQAGLGSREQTNAELCERLAALPLAHPPGTAWAYSRATDVLGRVIEVVTGQPLGAFLRESILQPLGMNETDFFVPPAQHHRIAEAFEHDPDGNGTQMPMHDPREVPALEMGGGGLMSTAHDYARFLQCLCNGGELNGQRLLSPHTVAYMTADHLGSAIPHADNPLLPPRPRLRPGLCGAHRGRGGTRGRLGGHLPLERHRRHPLLRRPRAGDVRHLHGTGTEPAGALPVDDAGVGVCGGGGVRHRPPCKTVQGTVRRRFISEVLMRQMFEGQCQCGAIAYRVTGVTATLFACHCMECQRQSSSAFGMALWVKDPSVELLSGAVKEWVRTMPSGRRMSCQFCADCGTRLFHTTVGQTQILSIKPGTLRDTSRLNPVGHIWVDRKQKWFQIENGALQYPGNPESFEALMCAWSAADDDNRDSTG